MLILRPFTSLPVRTAEASADAICGSNAAAAAVAMKSLLDVFMVFLSFFRLEQSLRSSQVKMGTLTV
jgi:hypothetical protein